MPKTYVWLGGLLVGLTGLTGASSNVPGPGSGLRVLPPGALSKLAPNVIVSSARTGEQSYIVQFDRNANRQLILAQAGVRVTRRYDHVPMAAVEADEAGLRSLALSRDVARISLDATVKRTMDSAIPTVGADLAHKRGWDGEGIGIAVLDSGVARHPDLTKGRSLLGLLQQRTVAGYDFIKNRPVANGNDECGHGTLVAGIAAGNAMMSSIKRGFFLANTKSFYGVAPAANILNLRILDEHGVGSVQDTIAAIDWCIQHKSSRNIRVMNLSLGHPPYESYRTDPLCQAVEAAWKAGIVVVCAAGNRGRLEASNQNGGVAYGTINSPGNDPYVITVGALNDQNTKSRNDDWIATYSSRGPSAGDHIVKPDLVAPGNMIISLRQPGSELETLAGGTNLIPLSYYWNQDWSRESRQYFHLSGTSMAAAVVSGAVAMMLERDPIASPDTIKARLMISARKTWRADGKTPDVFSRGAGLLNIPLSLRANFHVNAPALSPWAQWAPGGIRIHLARSLTGTGTWYAHSEVGASQALWADGEPPPPPGEEPPPPGEEPPPPPEEEYPPPPGGGDSSDYYYPQEPPMPPPPAEPYPTEYPNYYPPPPPPSEPLPPGEVPPPPPYETPGYEPPPPPYEDPYYYPPPPQEPPPPPEDPYYTPDDGQALWADRSFYGDYPGAEQQAQAVNTNPTIWSHVIQAGQGGIEQGQVLWGDQPIRRLFNTLWADIFRLCITGDR